MSDKRYKITKWKGLDNYECRDCPFATLNKRAMTQHIEIHLKRERQEEAKRKIRSDNSSKFNDPDHGLSKPTVKPKKTEKKDDKK